MFMPSSCTQEHASSQNKLKDAALLGVLCMAVSVALFPLSDACMKHLISTYSVQQTTFLRSLFRLSTLLLIASFSCSPFSRAFFEVLKTKQKKVQVKRILVSTLSTYCFMIACSKGSLTLLYTLGYAAPLFMVLISSITLKERVSFDRWIAVLVGMLGVVLACRPSSILDSTVGIAALCTLFGTFFAAMNKMYIRRLATTDGNMTIALYSNIALMLFSCSSLFVNFQPMPLEDWLLFAGIGCAMGLSQLLVIFSLRCAQASLLAPIDYSSFLWVVLLDMYFWEKWPDGWTLVGALCIMLSNIWIVLKSKKKEEVQST